MDAQGRVAVLTWVCRWRRGVGRITVVSTNKPTATVASCVASYLMQDRGLWCSEKV
jgi:hypothetical protein